MDMYFLYRPLYSTPLKCVVGNEFYKDGFGWIAPVPDVAWAFFFMKCCPRVVNQQMTLVAVVGDLRKR